MTDAGHGPYNKHQELNGHDVYAFARAQVRGYSHHDILLCPSTSIDLSNNDMDAENIDSEETD